MSRVGSFRVVGFFLHLIVVLICLSCVCAVTQPPPPPPPFPSLRQIWDGETLDYRVSIAAHSVGITSITSCFITPPTGGRAAAPPPTGSLRTLSGAPPKPMHMTKGPIVFTGAADGSIRVRCCPLAQRALADVLGWRPGAGAGSAEGVQPCHGLGCSGV